MSSQGELIPSMPREHYDGLPRMNWSRLKHLLRSPVHFRHGMTRRGPDTDAMKLGRAIHLNVFEPLRFPFECVEWTGKVRNGGAWDKFRAANDGKEILTAHQMETARAIGAAVRNDATAARYLEGGPAEVTALWTHRFEGLEQATGPDGIALAPIEMKARIDFVATGALVDLKTTKDASPEGFGRQIWSLRYHTQAALYQDAYFHATGRRLPFVLVAVEAFEPYVAQVYRLPDIALDAGRDEYRTLLGRLAICRATSRWPGYGDSEMEAELPKWSGLADAEDDISEMDLDLGGSDDGE